MPRAARVVRAKRAVHAVQVGKWAYLVSTAGACLQGMLHAARQREQHLAKMGRGRTGVRAGKCGLRGTMAYALVCLCMASPCVASRARV